MYFLVWISPLKITQIHRPRSGRPVASRPRVPARIDAREFDPSRRGSSRRARVARALRLRPLDRRISDRLRVRFPKKGVSVKYPQRIGSAMGLSEFLEGQTLTHRQMGAIMVAWIVLVTIVSVGLLWYTAANFA